MLDVRGISVRAGRNGPVVLHDVGFQVRTGELLVVLGANGSGKSTLLRTIGGELRPLSGSVRWMGRPMEQYRLADLARERAFLDQQSRVPFAFTAREVVRMGRYPFKGHDRERHDEEAVDMALEEMRATGFQHRPMPLLSGGEQQRVHIARMLAQLHRPAGPSLLLMDEPLNDLDIKHQHAVMELARAKAHRGACVIAVLHDVDLAARYADKLLFLQGGACMGMGRPAEVLDPGVLEAVYDMPAAVQVDPLTGECRVRFGQRMVLADRTKEEQRAV